MADPSTSQICKGSIQETKLTLLCETITYFSRKYTLDTLKCIYSKGHDTNTFGEFSALSTPVGVCNTLGMQKVSYSIQLVL